MRLICPSCGAMHSAEAWGNDEEARQAVALLADLPQPAARWAVQYLSLFRRAGWALSWKRVRKLLEEIRALVTAPTVSWDQGPPRDSSPEVWARAMEQMCCKPPSRLPLGNNNYLRSVAYEMAVDKGAGMVGGPPRPDHRGEGAAPTRDPGPGTVESMRREYEELSEEQLAENRRRAGELARGMFR